LQLSRLRVSTRPLSGRPDLINSTPPNPFHSKAENEALRGRLAAALADADASRLDRQAAECERDHAVARVAALEWRAAGLRERVARLEEEAQEQAAAQAGLRDRLQEAGWQLLSRRRVLSEVGAKRGVCWRILIPRVAGGPPLPATGCCRACLRRCCPRVAQQRRASLRVPPLCSLRMRAVCTICKRLVLLPTVQAPQRPPHAPSFSTPPSFHRT
jgi:hypothetical protein